MEIRIEDHSPEALEAKEAAIVRWLEEAGLHLEGEAKYELENDPRRVDTGLLRNSIAYAVDGDTPDISSYSGSSVHGDTATTRKNGVAGKPAPPPRSGSYSGNAPKEGKGKHAVYVGTNVEYAVYVHEGTQKMAANRVIKNAFNKNTGQLKSKLQQALMNA